MGLVIYAGLSRCPLGHIYIILEVRPPNDPGWLGLSAYLEPLRQPMSQIPLPQLGRSCQKKPPKPYCEYRQKEKSDGSQFKILVSPLARDPDRSHTERVMRAFLGEKGFLVVPICESLNFDFSTDLQTATDDVLQRAREVIKARHADLLLTFATGIRQS